MFSEKLLGEDLLQLQQEKGTVCVSVIVPTHRLAPERRGDITETEKAVEQAKELLRYKFGEKEIKPVVRNLEELLATIDFNHNQDGLGMYVSASRKMLVKFPFPVEKKIMADKKFELRDLLYKISFAAPYYVLLLTEKDAKLYSGSRDEVEEVRDHFFPAEFRDEYIYSTPSRSTSQAGQTHVKSFERDKSEMVEKRLKDFYREADNRLKGYLTDDVPLILAGPEKELAWFEKVTHHAGHIIHRVKGNYTRHNRKKIADLAWPAMEEYLQQKRTALLKEYGEILGAHRGYSGIQQVWEAAGEGKAFKLLVEKDYRVPGFVKENDPHLYLRPLAGPHRVLADAVDELIGTVLEKRGEVFFMDNGSLADQQRIALITRY